MKRKGEKRRKRAAMSIKSRLIVFFCSVVLVTLLVTFAVMQSSFQFVQEYSDLTKNITKATHSALLLNSNIYPPLYDIVIGRESIEQGEHIQTVQTVYRSLLEIQRETEDVTQYGHLETSIRTVQSLRTYLEDLEKDIRLGTSFEENIGNLSKIQMVVTLTYNSIQEYIFSALDSYESIRLHMQENANNTMRGAFIALACVAAFSVFALIHIIRSIYTPIDQINQAIRAVGEGDFDARVEGLDKADELAVIKNEFNAMMKKINSFREREKEEQQQRDLMELKLLQLQINPHFLYNALDTIVWSTELNHREQTIALVKALSQFFRIVLSNGEDWISLKEEIEHVKSYLAIQKIRYQDILEVEFDLDDSLDDYRILKLLLQPLVENALYHGIKNRRGKGLIKIITRRLPDDHVLLEVLDNGVGMSEERLQQVRDMINSEKKLDFGKKGSFGLSNVNNRIKLNYTPEYGLNIESEAGKGTRVTIVLPKGETKLRELSP